MINNIAILDTETTHISPKDGNLIEIACILYNVPNKTIIQQASTLLPSNDNAAFKINRISLSALAPPALPLTVSPMIHAIDAMIVRSDYIVAHNAEFDKSWIEQKTILINEIPWICSCYDFKWPDECNGAKKLTDIALSLDVPVVSAHRALTDCQLLAQCFSKLTDLEVRLEDAAKPRQVYISSLPFDKNDTNKEHGFQWDKLVPKKWAKKLTEEEAAALPFTVNKA